MKHLFRVLVIALALGAAAVVPVRTPQALAAGPTGCSANPATSPWFGCYYDAPQLQYTDGWKCSPPATEGGLCKTSTTGKKVTLGFYAQIGVYFQWRPSAANGSAQVKIDGVDRGLVWQGEDSAGFKVYYLSTGYHVIEIIKPARDSGKSIALQYISNAVLPEPPPMP